MNLRVLSVNVALPRIIACIGTEPVMSAIAKVPVTAGSVIVGPINIKGDAQADLNVHGGPDKAIYAYPSENWRWWEREQSLACEPGTFGENLTLCGATEDDIRIGDQFRWGTALLEVSQPRAPCYKFAIHTTRQDAPQLMTISARCGWYLRVREEGRALCAGGLLTRLSTARENPSVRQAFRALYHPNIPREERQKVRDTLSLADAWREGLTQRLMK